MRYLDLHFVLQRHVSRTLCSNLGRRADFKSTSAPGNLKTAHAILAAIPTASTFNILTNSP